MKYHAKHCATNLSFSEQVVCNCEGLPKSTITLTSKMGSFIFDRNVILSHAKLIRDSITGQFFNPSSNHPRINTELDAEKFAREHLSRDLAEIAFEVYINPMKVLV